MRTVLTEISVMFISVCASICQRIMCDIWHYVLAHYPLSESVVEGCRMPCPIRVMLQKDHSLQS